MLGSFQDQKGDCDMSKVVMAFRCSAWPAEAKGWLTRERSTGWPSAEVIKAAAATPCYVVGQAHQASSSKETQWHFRFPEVERIIAESLNDIQRQCYVLLKILQLQHLDLPVPENCPRMHAAQAK